MWRDKSGLTLHVATCFAPTTPNGGIQDLPFTSAAAEARLKIYLKKMGADDGVSRENVPCPLIFS